MTMTTLNAIRIAVLLALAPVLFSGCFRIDTPSGFVRLGGTADRHYKVRAVSPDGAVVGVQVRRSQAEGGTAGFWAESLERELIGQQGYRLLGRRELMLPGGDRGVTLDFEGSRAGQPYHYQVSVFVGGGASGSRVVLIEAGAAMKVFARHADAIAAAVASARNL
jgi:hypothetical protein